MCACFIFRYGHQSVVEYLMRNSQVDVTNKDGIGWTPLHQACRKGWSTVVEYLINERHVDLNSRNDDGLTPLHVVCR